MQAVIFSAGLGDTIRAFYQTDRYARICETRTTLGVILAGHNPYIYECFTHHPNLANLRVVQIPGKYDLLREKGLQGDELQNAIAHHAGFEPSAIVGLPSQYSPTFYACDDVYSSLSIVIQPFASKSHRRIPPSILRKIVHECLATGYSIHIITRSYRRYQSEKLTHDAEEIPPELAAHPSIHWHRNLSVPASLNLIKGCSLFIGCHSALLQAAWLENKPVFALYPDDHVEWNHENIGNTYTFGAFFPKTKHFPFSCFNQGVLSKFLAETVNNEEVTQRVHQNPDSFKSNDLSNHNDSSSIHQESLYQFIINQPYYKVQHEENDLNLTLFPDGWVSLEGKSHYRKWEVKNDSLYLLLNDQSVGVELKNKGLFFAGELHGTTIRISPEIKRKRYVIRGLQRTCTNLIQYFFEKQIKAHRVTKFNNSKVYWKHGWLPENEQLKDLFLIVCVRHPLHWLTACYDYFCAHHGGDGTICSKFNPSWTFEEFLEKEHYSWPTPIERWNVMNNHWLQRVNGQPTQSAIVRAEDCQTEFMQHNILRGLLAKFNPLARQDILIPSIKGRLTNTNQQTATPMDPTPYLHKIYLNRYTEETLKNTYATLDSELMRKLSYA